MPNKKDTDQPAKIVPEPLPPPPPVNTPIKNTGNHTMWDAFQHILLFISLYVFATTFAFLLNYFVDKWIIDASSSLSYRDYFSSTLLRGYLSAIVVSYPLFLFFFLKVTKRTQDDPTLRLIKARKILIYITLVITFIISLISVITIVFNFFNGEVTANFLGHFLVVFLISGGIFTYYTYQVKEDRYKHA